MTNSLVPGSIASLWEADALRNNKEHVFIIDNLNTINNRYWSAWQFSFIYTVCKGRYKPGGVIGNQS